MKVGIKDVDVLIIFKFSVFDNVSKGKKIGLKMFWEYDVWFS